MGMKSEGDTITCDCGFSFQRGQSGKHECADGLRAKLAAAVRREESLKASVDVLAQRVKDLEAAAIVPGVLRCAKCNYELMKTNLYFNSGTVGPGDSETEPCPNGCGPLWPVNWHAWAITGFAEAEKYHAQLQAAEQRLQQPIKLPDVTTNRHEWSTWQWIEHLGGRYQHGNPGDYIEFGSVMAVGAMLKQFKRTVIAVALTDIKASLRLQGFTVEGA